MSFEKPQEETNMYDEKALIREHLTGEPAPEEAHRKQRNSIANAEEDALVGDVKKELTAEGYVEKDGKWTKE